MFNADSNNMFILINTKTAFRYFIVQTIAKGAQWSTVHCALHQTGRCAPMHGVEEYSQYVKTYSIQKLTNKHLSNTGI